MFATRGSLLNCINLSRLRNPCPCGNYPDLSKCNCTEGQIRQYLGKISQPLLDRIDICVETPRVCYENLKQKEKTESSKTIRERVSRARMIQKERYEELGILTNAMLPVREIDRYCMLGQEEEVLMEQAFRNLSLTARTYHKILRVSRTIADLDGETYIRKEHITEAIGYRTIDKKYWGR